jgi:outer membrane protein assembly factor BamD (BamD/ComL family)
MTPARTARSLLLAALLASLAALASCTSTGPVDLTGLTPAEVFQRAQDASDKGDYRRALATYEAFLAQPDIEADRGAWARYETALLYHKLGDDDTALAKFDELLALYEKDPKLPEGPIILATSMKAAILEKREKKTPAKP